jgi:hypothetical protein
MRKFQIPDLSKARLTPQVAVELDKPELEIPIVTNFDPAKLDQPRSTPFGKALTSMPLCSTMPEVSQWAERHWDVIKFALLWSEVSQVAAEAEGDE